MKQKKKKVSYLLWTPCALANVLAVVEPRKDLLNNLLLLTSLLLLQTLATHAGLLLLVLQGLLDKLNVLETQLLANDVQISGGVHITLDVNDLGIIKSADHLEDGVNGANVRQESVTQASTSGRTARQTSNVIDSQVGGNHGLGLVLLDQPVEAIIRHNDTGLLGVDGSVGEILEAVSTPFAGRRERRGGFIQQGCQGCTW